MDYLRAVNGFVDSSCSAVVSLAVIGVNVYCLSWKADSVAVPVFTSACCATAALSKVLKRVIRQSRPPGAPKLSPGMPSNHATSLSFLSIVACAALDRAGVSSSTSASPARPLFGGPTSYRLAAAQVALMGYGLYATALRVLCEHHTWPQVIVGYALGSASAVLLLLGNYYRYEGRRAGGRVDELPHCVKVALLLASVATGFVAFRSILKGSPLVNRQRNSHG